MTATLSKLLRTTYQTTIVYAAATLAFHIFPMVASSQLDQLLNRAAPSFSIPDISGQIVRLADYQGRHVLIDFWSAGESTRLDDIPSLKQIQRRFGDSLVILSITNDNTPAKVQEVVEREGITWTQIVASRAEEDLLRQFGVEHLPAYHLVDPEGRLAHSGAHLLETIQRDGLEVHRGWISWLLLRVWGIDIETAYLI
jgi:peroxiredoxin